MKTKIIAVLATVVASFGCGVVWGQHISNNGDLGAGPWQNTQPNQPPALFYDAQGVLTNIERVGTAPYYRYIVRSSYGIYYKENLQEALVTARQAATEEQNENNRRIIEKKLGEFEYDILEKSNALNIAMANARDKTNMMEALANHTLKKSLPTDIEDPWRKVGGQTVLVGADSRFKRCGGKVLQTTGDGVLFLDIFGQNSFVKNYPHRYPDETMIWFVAMPSDSYSYTDVLGASRTVSGFDYGTPCQRPSNADAIEAEALKIKPEEERAIKESGEQALAEISKAQSDFEAAKKREQDYLQKFEQTVEDQKQAVQSAKDQKLKTAQDKALKFNQDAAAKGDPYGLLRMGERYRDGDGVPKDLTKAREYLTKAAATGSPDAADELSKLSQVSTNSAATQ
jgi:hypothetical protein